MRASPSAAFFAVPFGLVLALGAGCGSTTSNPTPDAGGGNDVAVMPDASGDGQTGGDASQDVPADEPKPMKPSQIYGPCNADSQCEDGLTCRTEAASGAPGGECNVACTSDEDCVLRPSDGSAAIDGWCQPTSDGSPRRCLRVCANGIDCERAGYTCRVFNSGQLNQVRACISVCTDDTCTHNTVCDHQSGRCIARGTTPTGRTLGQTCEPTVRAGSPTPPAEQQCVSQLCQADWTPDSRGNRYYTGWNGGYCISRCILPAGFNSSTFWAETTLPQSNCPMGGICFPSSTLARGDIGVCYQGCTTNADCRADQGYFCQKTVQLSATNIRRYQNGYCVPVNCLNTMTPCPMGFTCRVNAAGNQGQCIPSMPATP